MGHIVSYMKNHEKHEKCTCEAHIHRSNEEINKLIHRLNRIEGQVRGIKKMVEQGAYCTDILVQSAAVNAAINSFNKKLLVNHINTCVVDSLKEGRIEVIEELTKTMQKLMK